MMTSENGETRAGPGRYAPGMGPRYFYGWNVVGATFVMALFSFGLGFYGLTVYVAMLQRLHGWSASTVSLPVTVYYVSGALLTASVGDLYERFGPRAVVAGGSVAMAAGLVGLGVVTQPWQLYPVFLVMSLGWGSMSGAAINILLAPWFRRRRGLVLSIAFNGATLGGVLVAPTLMPLIGQVGFALALAMSALVLLVALVAIAVGVMRRGPEELGVGPDGELQTSPRAEAAPRGGGPGRGDALRTWRFWSVSAPFALGLAAQVGVLTHLVALVTPTLGTGGAATAVSSATAAALIGRSVTGFVVDRLNRRLVSSATLVVQIVGVALLAWAPSPLIVYAGCALFGLGVGNLVTLPGLILAVEWPRERFNTLVSLAVGINQFTFAFGPSLVGILRDWGGTYGLALGACMALQAIAAVLIVLGPGRTPLTHAGLLRTGSDRSEGRV
jgi:MFS family permease